MRASKNLRSRVEKIFCALAWLAFSASASSAGLSFAGAPLTPGATVRVSVLLPARNASATLREALGSMLEQTRPPDELVCVDDDTARAVGVVGGCVSAQAAVVAAESVALLERGGL